MSKVNPLLDYDTEGLKPKQVTEGNRMIEKIIEHCLESCLQEARGYLQDPSNGEDVAIAAGHLEDAAKYLREVADIVWPGINGVECMASGRAAPPTRTKGTALQRLRKVAAACEE